MSIQEAIQLNNQAVSFLESKLFNDAILCSSAAMQVFQHYQHAACQDSLQRDSDSIDQFMLDYNDKRSSGDTTNEFIYKHGIVLPIDIRHPRSVIIPVLIFNCALSHQLRASIYNDESARQKCLRRAKGLYQVACNQQDEDMNTIFLFAMFNNIGVIQKHLGDLKESKECFRSLVSSMMLYVDVGVESKRLQHIQGFWKNALENGGSMAPAA